MTKPEATIDRLSAIARLRLGETDAQRLLDSLARSVAKLLKMPIGLVSVVLSDAQWFAGQTGLTGWLASVGGSPREWSFCSTVVETGEPLVVPDAKADKRFANNLLVLHEGIRCYVGVPLITTDGHIIGSLCAIGDAAQPIDACHIVSMRELAAGAINAIESLPGRRGTAW